MYSESKTQYFWQVWRGKNVKLILSYKSLKLLWLKMYFCLPLAQKQLFPNPSACLQVKFPWKILYCVNFTIMVLLCQSYLWLVWLEDTDSWPLLCLVIIMTFQIANMYKVCVCVCVLDCILLPLLFTWYLSSETINSPGRGHVFGIHQAILMYACILILWIRKVHYSTHCCGQSL